MKITRSVLNYVASLPLTAHAIFCYEDPEAAFLAFRAYVDGAMERNEAVRILCNSKGTYEEYLKHVSQSALEGDRVKFMPISEVNLENGLALARSTIDEVSKLGYKGLRLFCLGNHYFAFNSPQEVVKLEKQAGHAFSLPMSAICAYDTTVNLDNEILVELLRAHGPHIFQGVAG